LGSLQDQVVVVTGASSGIGGAIARRCAIEGARVLAVGRQVAALHELADDSEQGAIKPFVSDLVEPGACDQVAAEAASSFGRIDGVVHAAGTVRRGEDMRKTTDGELSTHLDENLGMAFRMARAAINAMVETGGGSLVLLGSQLGVVGAPGYASYSAAKGGVTALARALAVDYGRLGVRVNVLAPGVVRTPMAYVDRPEFDELADSIAERHPLRRIGVPEDMAGPAVFLLGGDSAWLKGHTFVVDGGFTIQ
jgi:NAD(P)-dependent dehydrogenase (short-subunit alcohol dehydrogenase family)